MLKRKTTSLKIDPELWKKAKKRCIDKDTSISTYLESLIKQDLKLILFLAIIILSTAPVLAADKLIIPANNQPVEIVNANFKVNQNATISKNLTGSDSILADFIYPDSSGFMSLMGGGVGIGISSPLALLHVRRTSESEIARFESSQGNTFSIDSDGNIGINNTNPTAPLTISRALGDIIVHLSSNSGAFQVFSDQGAKDWAIGISDGSTALSFYEDKNIILEGTERMKLGAGGKLGINTSSPTHTLEVDGNINLSSIFYIIGRRVGINTTSPLANLHVEGNSTISAFFNNGYVGIGTSSPVQGLDVRSQNISLSTDDTNIISGTSLGSLSWYADDNSLGEALEKAAEIDYAATGTWGETDSQANLNFKIKPDADSLPSTVMAITQDGKVGIGTTNPGIYKLSVAGLVNASGYHSNGTDYAEALLKLNLSEKIEAGDVVGVKQGKITKNTDNAESLMVISTNPNFVGGFTDHPGVLPVAFIGQVPVKVRGPVNSGDYILPSGLNDGIGIAINPKTITFGQYREAIGIAWESSKEKIAKVNVAVGIK